LAGIFGFGPLSPVFSKAFPWYHPSYPVFRAEVARNF
jgi:hypothetical protein